MEITYGEYGTFRITPSKRWLIKFKTHPKLAELQTKLSIKAGSVHYKANGGSVTYGTVAKPTNKQLRRIKKGFYTTQNIRIKKYQDMLNNG